MEATKDNADQADNAALVEELLRGAVDLHCHSGPSVMPRRLDHLEALREASAAGLKAILLKDHYYSATPIALLLNKHMAHLGVTVLSGVPLNNPVGGINRYAVDHGIRLGAQLVWMPTFSAANHLDHHRHGKAEGFPTPREKMVSPLPLSVFDANGNLLDELKVVLDLIAEADVVLSGGHLNIKEIWPVFEEAKKRGVKRFLINHPTFVLDGTLEDIKAMAEFGAYIEHSMCMFLETMPFKVFAPDDLRKLIAAGTVDRTILASDLGQKGNPTPVEGLRGTIQLCLRMGYAPADIKKMISTNPSALFRLA